MGVGEDRNRRGNLFARSAGLSIYFCTWSKVVKLIENATGPFIQFIDTPFKKPRTPCSRYKFLTVANSVGGVDTTGRLLEHPSDVTALSLCVPTKPIVCIRRRVTSIGYVTVCATSPEKAPHCIRSMVVTSRPVMC